MLDTVISGGLVIDGSGRPGRHADVAIKDGRVVEIGSVDAESATTIDATGKVVCPGFIDIHTHYDAQAFWDRALTPSPLHGVTSIVGGNCGFSIAPLTGKPEDADYLLGLLARVEAMPPETLRAGVPWDWTSTAEYYDELDGTLAINAGFMVGHCAIRQSIMGRAAHERAATDDEVRAMQDLMRESLEAGGMGFSSSWTRIHIDPAGNMAPSRYATEEELVALSSVLAEYPGTSLEMNPTAGMLEPWAADLLIKMSAAAKRPVNWNLMMARAENIDRCFAVLDDSDRATEAGARIVALAGASESAHRVSIASGYVFDIMPGWDKYMLMPRSEKFPLLRDPALREKLREWAEGPDNIVPGFANWDRYFVCDVYSEENEAYKGKKLGDISKEEGRSSYDIMWDLALRDELLTTFGTPEEGNDDADWEARREVWLDPRTVVGGSDAGAHVEMFATFNFTTRLLSDGVRRRNLIPMERAIQLLTDEPARLYGMTDRGQLRERAHADVVVFDPETIGSHDAEIRSDLPGGTRRLYAGADGIDYVLVAGVPIVVDGELTKETPGRILRSGSDTGDTVTV